MMQVLGGGRSRRVVWIRVTVGVWLLVATGIACADGRWWGAVLLAPAALHFWLAYRGLRRIQE